MARILAVDWDRHEARYVLVSTSGDSLSVRAAGSVPLVDVAEGGNAPHPDVGGSLRAALAERKVSATSTIVAVERSSIELLHFTVPPATDTELPELVANQAMRESQLVSEDSVLDFVPSGDSPGVPRGITAAVLSAEQLEHINTTCETAGLKPKRLLLRPYASASLFGRVVPDAERICLLVNQISEEVDLVFLVDGRVAFFRTVRLPKIADRETATRRLLAEIGRTLVVASQNELGEEKVESVYIFGGSGEHEDLADRIHDELSLPVNVVDPFEKVEVHGRAPEHPGRFAALLGMLTDEALGTRHAIDFLNPRRKPKPLNRKRIATFAAGLIATALAVVGSLVWLEVSTLDDKIAQRAKQLREMDVLLKQAEEQRVIAASLNAWEAGNLIWLDELRDLSERFPTDRDMVVLRMAMAASSGGGSITFDGLVRDPAIVVRMEQSVRDQYHDISSKRVQQQLREKAYAWHFETKMRAAKRDVSQYVNQPAPSAPLTTDAASVPGQTATGSQAPAEEPVP